MTASPLPLAWGEGVGKRPLAIAGAFGFVAGLPLALTGAALLQWLRDGHASLAVVGYTANIGLSYTLKFLWAPVLDRTPPPPILRRLGQRRGWLVAIQALLAFACTMFAFADPGARPYALLAAAALVAFASANQDIVIDAWRIETFPERLQGAALACYIWGYRIALLVAGPGAIRLSVEIGWTDTLLAMAALASCGLLVTLAAREPETRRVVPPGNWIRTAVLAPLRDLLQRPSAARILGFVALFKLGEALAHRVAYSFYGDLGYSARQVADATGIPGLLASLAGAALGGWLVLRIGAARALIITGFVQMASMALYFALAVSHGEPAHPVRQDHRRERRRGHGGRGLPDVFEPPLLAGLHGDAIRPALLAGRARPAHGRRVLGPVGAGARLGPVLRADRCSPPCPRC